MNPLQRYTDGEGLLLPPQSEVLQSLDDYKRLMRGCQALLKSRELSPEKVVDIIQLSGLRGRGGAGFPTHIKWRGLLADTTSEVRHVVCNGSEGEPGTYKDRYLLKKNPYSLVEGLLIAKENLSARSAVIGIKGKYIEQIANIQRVINEFIEEGLCQEGDIEIVEGPDEYLFGEEKALLEFIDTRSNVMPRHFPPYIKGIYADPRENSIALVNNIETYSHLPGIIQDQGQRFLSKGTEKSRGTTIFTVCGDVKKPGMYELPYGVLLKELLYDIAGGSRDERFDIKAVCSGVANPVMTQDMFDSIIDYDELRANGGGLGSAGFIVYDESVSMLKVVRTLIEFLAVESCGQCSPCKGGGSKLVSALKQIEEEQPNQKDFEKYWKSRLYQESEAGRQQTRCFLSHEMTIVMKSFLDKFSNEFFGEGMEKVDVNREPILGKIIDYNEQENEFIYQNYTFSK